MILIGEILEWIGALLLAAGMLLCALICLVFTWVLLKELIWKTPDPPVDETELDPDFQLTKPRKSGPKKVVNPKKGS